MTDGPNMKIQTFERGSRLTPGMRMFGRRFYFRIVDIGNNEILAQSQPYKTERQRDNTAKRLADAIGCPIIPERKGRNA